MISTDDFEGKGASAAPESATAYWSSASGIYARARRPHQR
jgi:hypothetical protein